MYAIISSLDEDSAAVVRELWKKLQGTCGLKAIFDFPTPHFTWFVADELDVSRTRPILDQIAQSLDPITVRTFGLGLFSGEHPVLYLPVVKTMVLMDYHREIWDQTQPYSDSAKLYYAPGMWVPHVTLALKDLDMGNLGCAVQSLGFGPLDLVIKVDHLMMVEHQDGEVGLMNERFDFGER
jgi:2'-5' RNA ligase